MMSVITNFAAACPAPSTFLNFPTWYQYLSCENDPMGQPTPVIGDINDIWAIGLAIIDILLRLAGMALVGYILYGGFQYMTSQGEADRTAAAKNILLNAVIGLVIVMIAAGLVGFVGGLIR
jgi:hypothetical protein